jgi:D-sedoheptulose 7-phosphate isomerase
MATAIAPAKTKEKDIVVDTLWESSRTLRALAHDAATIRQIAELLIAAYRKGNKMVLFGNGGSAADAQHIAAELVGHFGPVERPSLPALALTTDTSALTAPPSGTISASSRCSPGRWSPWSTGATS